mgnify:FL=1|jgi:hypothetical protein
MPQAPHRWPVAGAGPDNLRMRAATSGTNPCTNPWLLYQETATRVDLEAIEALCKYFNVQVGELFELTDA